MCLSTPLQFSGFVKNYQLAAALQSYSLKKKKKLITQLDDN